MAGAPSPSSTARRRGGQAGEREARKQGSHARLRDYSENAGLDPYRAADLGDEIAMLRALIRRIDGLAAGTDDSQDLLRQLGVLGLAMGRLARLLKTQQILEKEAQKTEAALSAGLAKVIKEMVSK